MKKSSAPAPINTGKPIPANIPACDVATGAAPGPAVAGLGTYGCPVMAVTSDGVAPAAMLLNMLPNVVPSWFQTDEPPDVAGLVDVDARLSICGEATFAGLLIP